MTWWGPLVYSGIGFGIVIVLSYTFERWLKERD